MLNAKLLRSITEIPRETWDALLTEDAAPFLEWTFLQILEESGCASPERGWTPSHLTLWREGRLVAAAPAYLKTHSWGEFTYVDFSWDQLAAQLGVRYFPKLVLGVPFSPATGPRILTAQGEDRPALVAGLCQVARELARSEGYGGVHVHFPRTEDLEALQGAGFLRAAGMQFHWLNAGYPDFNAFLARFNSKRRSQLKAERAQLARDGTTVRTLTGSELTPEVMRLVTRAYFANLGKHAWSEPHLNESFYLLAGERFSHRAEVVVAEEDGRPIGAAFNLRGDKRLYGRQWGALEDRRYLHFNVCYYHSIERCIARGLSAFEPGAGGEHKMVRGFEPTVVHSVHWFPDQRLQAALAGWLPRQVARLEAQVATAREAHVAFRAGALKAAFGG